jgi:hypothetical protein
MTVIIIVVIIIIISIIIIIIKVYNDMYRKTYKFIEAFKRTSRSLIERKLMFVCSNMDYHFLLYPTKSAF